MPTTNLHLKRFHLGSSYAVGRLSIDNAFVCFTLEDAVREIAHKPVSDWKIAGRTAIPRGTYDRLAAAVWADPAAVTAPDAQRGGWGAADLSLIHI